MNSLINKLDELKLSILNTTSSIILITETWLNKKIPDSLLNLPGFTLHRKDREGEGGGVCIYVKDNIAGHIVSSSLHTNLSTTGPVESIWLEITVSRVKFVVACIYRPKASTTIEDNNQLLSIVEAAMQLHTPVFIFGDFNYPEIDWTTLTVFPNNQCSLDFLNNYKTHRGEQMIYFPTRIRNSQISLLDLLIVNDKLNVFDIQDHPPLGRSDHIVITAKSQLQLPIKPTHKIYKRNFWNADYNQINNFLVENLNPEGEHTFGCDNLTEVISTAIERYIPLQRKKTNPQKPWISNTVFREIQKKRKLWHKY